MLFRSALFAIRTHGSYSSVAFDDALIHAVIKEMGGWKKFCSTPDDRLLYTAKEFQERYRDYATKIPASHPKYLVGTIGGRIEFVGNKEKILQVITTGYEPNLKNKQLSVDVKQIDTDNAVDE